MKSATKHWMVVLPNPSCLCLAGNVSLVHVIQSSCQLPAPTSAQAFLEMEEKQKSAPNFAALTPVLFLDRAAEVHPHRSAIIYGKRTIDWSQVACRCHRLASALIRHGISKGDVVAVFAPNVPAMYEVQFGVPMAGAILNCINIRLNVYTVGVLLRHSQAKAILVDQDFLPLVKAALSSADFKNPFLVRIRDDEFGAGSEDPDIIEYEDLLKQGDPKFTGMRPDDEGDVISICYTSGTTASPKGVMLTHRGAYLAAVSNCITWEMKNGAVYLWTLPLFHCNGWCFPWAIAALSGTNICLRQVTAKAIYAAIAAHNVTNFCAAPTVLSTIINAPDYERISLRKLEKEDGVRIMTAGAAPAATVLDRIEALGFHVTHTYGLTETYGPSVVCEWKPEWDKLPPEERAKFKSRQGVRYLGLEEMDVVNSKSMMPVARDGVTMGEVVMRGNIVMKGYLRNEKETEESFRGGWFHSGDVGVRHTDGYIEIKDREKDIIISGGENISSLEVENILYKHPCVMEAAVVARPDEKWGESACAFVALKSDSTVTVEDIREFCRNHLPHFMVPKTIVFGSLHKTATGKIQKHLLRDRAKAMGLVTMRAKL